MKIKYDSKLMHYMSVFSNITNTKLKDCFIDNNDLLTFIVEEKELGKAVGKRGFKVRLIEKSINRKIKIVEFNPDQISFLKNVIYPIRINHVETEGKLIKVEAADSKGRGLLIGRGAEHLRNYESIIKRYFDIDEIRVM